MSQRKKEEQRPNKKTGNDVSIDTATGYLAACPQYSHTDQNSIRSLAISFISEGDQRITEGKAEKDTAETKPLLLLLLLLSFIKRVHSSGLRFHNNLINVFVEEHEHSY